MKKELYLKLEYEIPDAKCIGWKVTNCDGCYYYRDTQCKALCEEVNYYAI